MSSFKSDVRRDVGVRGDRLDGNIFSFESRFDFLDWRGDVFRESEFKTWMVRGR
jgi:hypothetical protein